MFYITAVIKTDFHTYFYRTIVLKKGTGNPLLDTGILRTEDREQKTEDRKTLLPVSLKREGPRVRGAWDAEGLPTEW